MMLYFATTTLVMVATQYSKIFLHNSKKYVINKVAPNLLRFMGSVLSCLV